VLAVDVRTIVSLIRVYRDLLRIYRALFQIHMTKYNHTYDYMCCSVPDTFDCIRMIKYLISAVEVQIYRDLLWI